MMRGYGALPCPTLTPASAQVRKIVSTAYERTLALLGTKRELVTALAERLLEKEVRVLRAGTAGRVLPAQKQFAYAATCCRVQHAAYMSSSARELECIRCQ